MNRLLIATTNAGKRDEYRALLADLPYEIVGLADVGLGEMDVDETGTTYFDNALIKARTYQSASGLTTLADDSGISVDALNGAPGVYSARYAPTVAERNAKLLDAVKDIPAELRTARFICVIAIMAPDHTLIVGEGAVEGVIAYAPRGTFGHGYDPIFELPDGRTMAELPQEEKNELSHRGRALAKVYPLLGCLGAQL